MRLALVYQNGLANVFDITRSGDVPELAPFTKKENNPARKRLLQHAFSPCEWFVRGAVGTGYASVQVFHCDQLGDASLMDWEPGPGNKYRNAKDPPKE